MFCSQCGAKTDPSSKFCSVCGAKIHLVNPTDAPISKEPASVENEDPHLQKANSPIVKKRVMPLWFKAIAFLAVLALIGVTAGILFTESLVDVVDSQLAALRAGDIYKAYNSYTSSKFKELTSQDDFRQFVQTYPIFSENQSAHFTQRTIKDHVGILRGNLTSKDHVNTPVEFKLIKEGDKWKILSVRLIKPHLRGSQKKLLQTEDLIRLAKEQLTTIQNQNLKQAYEQFTADEFKKTTSFENFKSFIERYPILTNYQTISFHSPMIRKSGVGTLSAILKSDQLAADVKYHFIQEDKGWKIWSMRISGSAGQQQDFLISPTFQPNQMHLGSIIFSDHIDDEGMIIEPKTKFSTNLNNLHIEISVQNGIKGQVVNLNLQNQENGTSIPAKATIEENGNSLLVSEFTPPSQGWPKGQYKLIVTTSSGLSQVATFEIE